MRLWLIALLVCFVPACTDQVEPDPNPIGCEGGRCDAILPDDASFILNLNAANSHFPSNPPITSVEDMFRVVVTVGEGDSRMELPADTHLFGPQGQRGVNIIPFDDAIEGEITDSVGHIIGRGDGVIGQFFAPGELGIGVRHHRPEHRSLDLNNANPVDMKEHFKFEDTHIEIIVGVERDGQNGAVTLNNPQDYQNGRFGTVSYAPILLRPFFDDAPGARSDYQDNIRTMLVGFNSVTVFPSDYNGGDPVAAVTVEAVQEHVVQMVLAITGDEAARQWFLDPQNMVYCAELAHLGFSAGLLFPLNDTTMVPLVGEDVWNAFKAIVEQHNNGEETAFTSMNDNPHINLINLAIANENLQPAASDGRLAFQPMTMADMVEQFMAGHLPRRDLGESLAPVQGTVLQAMLPGLLQVMGLDKTGLPADAQARVDQSRLQVEELFAQIVTVVSTPYPSYEDFRTALEPFLAQARVMTGPAGGGLQFVPPSLMHVVAQGSYPEGLVRLEYVGHAIHFSLIEVEGLELPDDPVDIGPTLVGATLLSERHEVEEAGEWNGTITAPEGSEMVRIEMKPLGGEPHIFVTTTGSSSTCMGNSPMGVDEVCELATTPGEELTINIQDLNFDPCAFELTVSY